MARKWLARSQFRHYAAYLPWVSICDATTDDSTVSPFLDHGRGGFIAGRFDAPECTLLNIVARQLVIRWLQPTRNSHPPARADYLPEKGNTSFRREVGTGK